MLFSLIENIRFDFSFPPVPQFGCLCPFVVIKKFPVGFQADHVILFQMVEDEKYLIVIITTVHNKGSFSEKSSSLSDRIKCDSIYRFIVLLSSRMDPGKDTDRMLAGSQGSAATMDFWPRRPRPLFYALAGGFPPAGQNAGR